MQVRNLTEQGITGPRRLTGILGLVLCVQVVLAVAILAQQLTWFLGGPRIEVASDSGVGWVVRSLAWDPFFAALAIVSAVVLALFVGSLQTKTMRLWQSGVMVILLWMYWGLLIWFLEESTWTSWLTGKGSPVFDAYDHMWSPNDLLIQFRVDPVTQALLWLGGVQIASTCLAILAIFFQDKNYPIRIWHFLLIMLLIGVGIQLWRVTSWPYAISWG